MKTRLEFACEKGINHPMALKTFYARKLRCINRDREMGLAARMHARMAGMRGRSILDVQGARRQRARQNRLNPSLTRHLILRYLLHGYEIKGIAFSTMVKTFSKANRTMPKAAVLGFPVAHSRSPLIHRFWLDHYGIDGTYEKFAVRPEDFKSRIEALRQEGFVGFNVTMPIKGEAFACADRVSAIAEACRSVNTLWWNADGLLVGDNSDVYGFLSNLDEACGGSWRGTRAIVVGAGGAAFAAVYALITRGLNDIAIVNRTPERAQAMLRRWPEQVRLSAPDLREDLQNADVLVNASPLGMHGFPPLEIDLDALSREAVVYDLIYAPRQTTMIDRAKARGNQTVCGLGMLLHQAVPGFAHWFGLRPEVNDALRQRVDADLVAAGL